MIKHPYAGEGYREGIKNLARWYAEGLIDAEIFTRGSSSRDFLLSEGYTDPSHISDQKHDWWAAGGPSPGGITAPTDLANCILWLDSDTSTLWQDDGRTTPVTANGDPVADVNLGPALTPGVHAVLMLNPGGWMSNELPIVVQDPAANPPPAP